MLVFARSHTRLFQLIDRSPAQLFSMVKTRKCDENA